MSTLVWIIGGIALVDLTIVAWFVMRDVLERGRAQREVERLNELWRAPTAPLLRLVRSSVGGSSGRGDASAEGVPIAPPILEQWPRARKASFVAFTGALVALLVVVAVDTGAPPAERAVRDGGTNEQPWTFGSGSPVDGTTPASSVGPSASSGGPGIGTPPLRTEPGRGAVEAEAPGPDRLAAEPRSPERILLAWVRVPDAVGYLIERWDSPADASAGWSVIGSTGAEVTTYVDAGLESGTTYYYRVSAVTESGEPAPSDVVSATTLPGPPDMPVIVAVTNGNTIKVEWSDVGGETAYRIERGSVEAEGGWEAIATVGQDVTLYVDGGLEEGTTYSYRVVATSGSGDSLPSNVVTVTADAADEAPPDPGSQSEETAVDEGQDAVPPTVG